MSVDNLKIQRSYKNNFIVLMADNRRRFRYGSFDDFKLNLLNFEPLEQVTLTATAVGLDANEEVSVQITFDGEEVEQDDYKKLDKPDYYLLNLFCLAASAFLFLLIMLRRITCGRMLT